MYDDIAIKLQVDAHGTLHQGPLSANWAPLGYGVVASHVCVGTTFRYTIAKTVRSQPKLAESSPQGGSCACSCLGR